MNEHDYGRLFDTFVSGGGSRCGYAPPSGAKKSPGYRTAVRAFMVRRGMAKIADGVRGRCA